MDDSNAIATGKATVQQEPAKASPADIVGAWFVEKFHNSPVSRNTEVWNYVQAAKDDLLQRLGKEA
jgi:hypothetical protein